MDTIKNLLNTYARPFAAKYATRAVLYGMTALTAKLSMDNTGTAGTAQVVGEWLATAACAAAAMLCDWLHHRADTTKK